MTVELRLSGWFQARFATDPDPYDHPRGARGWTFAVDGEPDFDRIVRFQNPVASRSFARRVDVRVDVVVVNGAPDPGHPLLGAEVVLQNGPKFEGHNGDIAPDGNEPIFPFDLRIAAGGITVRTKEWLTFGDLGNPRGLVRNGNGVEIASVEALRRILNGQTPDAFMSDRLAALRNALAAAPPGIDADALRARIDKFDRSAMGNAAQMMSARVSYRFDVPPSGKVVVDPTGNSKVDPDAPWRVEFAMLAWDRDALQGFIEGGLRVG